MGGKEANGGVERRKELAKQAQDALEEADEVLKETSIASGFTKEDWTGRINELEVELNQWRKQLRTVRFLPVL
jgi:hypothetical protein